MFDIVNAEWDPALGYAGAFGGSTRMHVVSFDGHRARTVGLGDDGPRSAAVGLPRVDDASG